MNMMEARLVSLAKDGEREAFAELVNIYKGKLFHLAYRMLSNRQEAEDVVQDTFMRAYEHLERYDAAHKFSTWIYRIATNLCIDRLRRKKVTYSLDADVSDGDGLDGYSVLHSKDPSPEQELILSERQQVVRRAMDALPVKYKSAMALKYYQDLSLQEISDILDIPVSTVKTRIHRGRDYLRRRLEKDKEWLT
ncbi:MAG: RNA polymerase sigma factor SigW [Paenibacillaceae bacterium]